MSDSQSHDFHRSVENLGVRHRAKAAIRALVAAGPDATPAVREGLRHRDPAVRVGCCRVLDHHLDEAAVPELIENVTHPNARVRAWAIHALACDHCKEGACRPGEDQVVPLVARAVVHDENRHVRQMAAGMLGPSVHRSRVALDALVHASQHDPHPAVRKVARWYTPGGPIYRKLAPKGP